MNLPPKLTNADESGYAGWSPQVLVRLSDGWDFGRYNHNNSHWLLTGNSVGEVAAWYPLPSQLPTHNTAKTCQTCKHYMPNPKQCMGNCRNPELPNRVDPNTHIFDTLAVSPDFGCILHTPKADDPQT